MLHTHPDLQTFQLSRLRHGPDSYWGFYLKIRSHPQILWVSWLFFCPLNFKPSHKLQTLNPALTGWSGSQHLLLLCTKYLYINVELRHQYKQKHGKTPYKKNTFIPEGSGLLLMHTNAVQICSDSAAEHRTWNRKTKRDTVTTIISD